jgi:hypothetical protein
MAWWYEPRGADNRLVELRRGFPSEVEAREAAERALKKLKFAYPKTETLGVVTGADPAKKRRATRGHRFAPLCRVRLA